MARYAAAWIDVTSWAKSIVQNGSMKGIAIGPGPSTALTYYGSFSTNPRLRITYTRWV
jgi:hypothetical protein